MARPIIGISGNLFEAADRPLYKNKALNVVERSLADAIVHAGGTPIALPVLPPEHAVEHAQVIDALVLSGGADVDPSSYGEAPRGWTGQLERDRYELALVRAVRERGRPVLGICRGHQLLNVAFGGTLLHDIATDRPTSLRHRDQGLYDTLRHGLTLAPETLLAQLFDERLEVEVNSVHHQAIGRLGEGLTPVAWASDGLIEAVVARDDAFTWGVQWHPEWDAGAAHIGLFRAFVDAAESRARSRSRSGAPKRATLPRLISPNG